MKNLKVSFLVLFSILALSNLCFGADADSLKANINKGNIQVGGNIGFAYATGGYTNLQVAPSAQYFVADHLSIGGLILFDTNNSSTTYSIGPVVSYYFWQQDKVALYGSVGYVFYKPAFTSDEGEKGRAQAAVGANYFFTPSVAFGPSLTYEHAIYSPSDVPDIDELILLGSFSIYL